MKKQGYFVRHKVTGFETYIPAEQWDESFRDQYHVRDPEAELKANLRAMREASDRHDAEIARRKEVAAKAAAVKSVTPPKE